MSKLPRGWFSTNFSEVLDYVQRGKSPKYADVSELPVINQKCVRWWGIEEEFLKFIREDQHETYTEERFLQIGDVLWNSTGTGTIGRAALYSGLKNAPRAVVDGHVTILRSSAAIEPNFLFNFIRSPSVQNLIEEMQSGSTSQVELSKTVVLKTEIPLPPLPEQRRIVKKLNTLSTHTFTARTHLNAIAKLVEKYRHQVLELAFAGSLTKHLRDEDENGSEKMSRLPKGWQDCLLGEISEIQGGIQVGKKRSSDAELIEVPYLRVANVQRGWLNLEEIKTIFVTHQEKKRLLLKDGDILMNEGGGSRQTWSWVDMEYSDYGVHPPKSRV